MDKEKKIIFCIPLTMAKTPPDDQPGCQRGNCEICETDIWISQKKRDLKALLPNDHVILCGYCAVSYCGQKPQIVDLKKVEVPNTN